jgi:tetratricopeptide (TPR) repeat protein
MHASLGDVLAASGDRAAAVAAFERAVAIDPSAPRPPLEAGTLLMQMDQLERAHAHLEAALRLDPYSPRARSDLVQARARLGDFAGAMRMLRAHVEALPRDTGLSAMLARFLATSPDPALRDPEEAVRIAERLRRQTRGQDVHVLDTLASAYAAARRFADAHATALAAQARAIAIGDSARAAEIGDRASAYAQGRDYWSGRR